MREINILKSSLFLRLGQLQCPRMFLLPGALIGSVPQISVLQAKFCWLGDVEEITRSWKRRVAGKKIILGVWTDLMCRIAAMCYLSENSPPPHWRPTPIFLLQPPPPPSPVGCLCFTRGICNLIEPEERKHLHIETLFKFKYEDHCWARSALKVNLSRNEIPFPLQLGARQLPRRLLSTREWFEEHPTISR